MLEQVLTYLNNWFLTEIHDGTFTIQDGSITLSFLQTGQYFRIIGSVFNDGLHQYPATYLTDEEFSGAVWALAVPKIIVTAAEEIKAWQEKNGDIIASPYTSESFGGYAYTKPSAGDTDASISSWQDVFKTRLSAYKKPRELGYVQPSRPPAQMYRRPFHPDFPLR